MRTIPPSITEAIEAGATHLAHVWRIVRRDGESFAFTDHDRTLSFDGAECTPNTGLRMGAVEKSVGLSIDSASLEGALAADAITESDLARGLWDGARVDVFRVDWRDPSQRYHVFAGRIGEVRRGASAFEAELRGLQAALNKPIGRVFSRTCDADLGDARCGKDVSGAALRGEGVVSAVIASASFRALGLGAYVDGWFTRGRLVWAEGGANEVALHRLEGDEAIIELLDEPGAVLALGAGFVVTAGCDKRFATCKSKFANSFNFRGFPHMPGNDVVQAGPSASEPHDGGSRFS